MSSRGVYVALTPEYTTEFSVDSQQVVEAEPILPQNVSSAKMDIWRRAWHAIVQTYQVNVGLLLITASQALLSMVNVGVKKLNSIDPPVSTFELIAVRMIITYACSIAYMLYAKVPDPWLGPRGVRLLLIFRGFSGFFGLFGMYYSLQYLSLSDATVLTFLSPLVTGIAGAIFLKENFEKREALASLFSLFGVILIARPVFLFGSPTLSSEIAPVDVNAAEDSPQQRLIAVGVAMLGVLGSAGAYTSITAIGRRAHPLHTLAFFSTLCVIVAVVGMIAEKSPVVLPTVLEWLALLIMIGVFGFIAQIFLTMGLQRETAGRGSIAIYTQVIFATILERMFFEAETTVYSVIGTIIIVTAALYVAATKAKAKETNSMVSIRLNVMQDTLEEGLLESFLAENDEPQMVRKRSVIPAESSLSHPPKEEEEGRLTPNVVP